MVTIGIDASTSTCGIAIVDNDDTNKIKHASFVDLKKEYSFKEKIEIIKNHIDSTRIDFDIIVLESPLIGFAGGFTKQQILVKLARFNGICEYVLGEYYKKDVVLVNATTARKALFGKARVKGMKPKDFVKNELERMFDLSKFKTLNKLGKTDKRIVDVRDSIVLACYRGF